MTSMQEYLPFTFAKHSSMVQMSNTLSLNERRIMNGIILHAQECMKRDPTQVRFSLTLGELLRISGITGKTRNNASFKKAIDKLYEQDILLNVLGKHKKIHGRIRILSERYIIENGS